MFTARCDKRLQSQLAEVLTSRLISPGQLTDIGTQQIARDSYLISVYVLRRRDFI